MSRIVLIFSALFCSGLLLADTATATFAGGCFWCMEPPYDEQAGVIKTVSGYTGGKVKNPGYKQVTAGGTGHYEAVQITYDPDKVSYEQLLDIFWRNIDPFDASGQFCDKGQHYRAAIFYQNEAQDEAARHSMAELDKHFEQPIVTKILPAETFYPAEDYHQNYYEKNPIRYKFYRYSCGRDARLEEIWGEQAGG